MAQLKDLLVTGTSRFLGDIYGNASSASKLITARMLTIGKTGENFDGSKNISWNINDIGAYSLYDRGIQITSGEDINSKNSIDFGNYYVPSANVADSIINSPFTSCGYRLICQAGYTTNSEDKNGIEGHGYQLAFGSFNNIKFRCNDNGTWTDWNKIMGSQQAIPYIVGSSEDSAGVWTGNYDGITSLTDGLTIIYVPAVAGLSSGTTLNINGLGAKTCYYTNTSKLTTHFAANTPILFTYVGGYWKRADYDSNTNTQIRIYRQTSGYDADYPIIVSRTATSGIGTSGTNSTYTGVYGVIGNNGVNTPTINPHSGLIKSMGYTLGANGTADMSTGILQIKTIKAPISSESNTYGVGNSGQILKSNGATIYWGADNNTHYITKLFATTSSGTSHATTTNGNTYLRLFDDSTARQSIKLTGSGATSITSDNSGNITINSTAYSLAKYNTLGLVKPAYTSTNSATLTTAAASNTTVPTIAAKTTTSNRYYGIEADKNGYLFVNVPWIAYSNATTTAAGLMSASDKTKLDTITTSDTDNYLPLSGGTMTGTIITPGNDTYGIRPATANYGRVGTEDYYFYEMYSNRYFLKGSYAKADMSSGTLQVKTISAPTTNGGASYGAGSDGQVLKSNGSTVYWGTVSGGTSYTLPQATNNTLGGVKIGYSGNGKNYPVELNNSGQMYVNVPWTSTSITDYCTLSTAQTITGAKTFSASTTFEYSPTITENTIPKIILMPNSSYSGTTSKAYIEGLYSDVIKLWIDSDKTTVSKNRRGLELHGYKSKTKVSESLRLRGCDADGIWSDLLVYHQGNIVYHDSNNPPPGATPGMIWLKPI